MSVGHHLRDRAHVIKKSKNSKTGDEEVNQEFINMNESESPQEMASELGKLDVQFLQKHFTKSFDFGSRDSTASNSLALHTVELGFNPLVPLVVLRALKELSKYRIRGES